jgi:hypothetical protein
VCVCVCVSICLKKERDDASEVLSTFMSYLFEYKVHEANAYAISRVHMP